MSESKPNQPLALHVPENPTAAQVALIEKLVYRDGILGRLAVVEDALYAKFPDQTYWIKESVHRVLVTIYRDDSENHLEAEKAISDLRSRLAQESW